MINGITYFKFKSPYSGDVTKNCALTGPEIDNNFFTLEGRDVKSLTVEDADIVLTLLDGTQIKAKDALENVIVNVSYDNENGILKIYYQDGRIEELDGFTTSSPTTIVEGLNKVSTDETVDGNGTPSKPIGISPLFKTGQYRPVEKIVETKTKHCEENCKCHKHKDNKNPKYGERYLVAEKIGTYGFLYNFKDVAQIACDLQKENSSWRIPTKEDWDDMLNAVELCDSDKDHSKGIPNKYLGRWAGKLLKSKYYWKKDDKHGCKMDNEYFDNSCDCDGHNPCKPIHCGEFTEHNHLTNHKDTEGVDKYGFGVLPAGYADDGGNILFFGERAAFWTSTNMHFTNIFEKRFEYNKANVYQDVIPAQNYLSVRLVKDYDGNNYVGAEDILGQTYPTVLMPSESKGKAVWTAVNLSVTGKHYRELVPNHGQDMTFVTKYFIEEWNGKEWVRNEFKEGDSVVVKESEEGDNIEYRLVNSKLVSVASQIYENVVSNFEPVIKNLEEKLDAEISRSTQKDEEILAKVEDLVAHDEVLDKAVEDLKSQIDSVDSKVDETNIKLDNTNKVLADFGAETKKAFDIINDVLTQSINNINTAIQTEHDERVNDIANVNERIDELSASTDTKFEELETKLDGEVKRLEEVDENLTKQIEEETTARTDKDNEIEGRLLVADGTLFDVSNGVLTLKSQSGDSDIHVQFTLNMGNF